MKSVHFSLTNTSSEASWIFQGRANARSQQLLERQQGKQILRPTVEPYASNGFHSAQSQFITGTKHSNAGSSQMARLTSCRLGSPLKSEPRHILPENGCWFQHRAWENSEKWFQRQTMGRAQGSHVTFFCSIQYTTPSEAHPSKSLCLYIASDKYSIS